MRSLVGTFLDRAPLPFAPVSGTLGQAVAVRDRDTREAELEAMGAVGTLFSIINRTSNSTAATRWHLWRVGVSTEDRVEVLQHAALDTMRRPNPYMPWQEFAETFQQHIDLTGEAYWILSTDTLLPGVPLELWPVRPDKMEPVPDRDNFLAGYVYSGPNGDKIPFGVEEVIMLRVPDPTSLYRGMGPVRAIRADLESTIYSAQWNRNFFLNSAEPGGLIQVDQTLQDHEFRQMQRRWNEQHRGVAKAHRVAIIEHGKWIDRSYSQRDMQFVEMRKMSRDTIMEAYGISQHMLGITEDVNRANAEAGEVMFQRNLIVPRLERIKAALNNEYLPRFGSSANRLMFDYDNPIPDNDEAENNSLKAKGEFVQRMVSAGYDPAAVLEVADLPPMDWHGVPAGATPPQFAPDQTTNGKVLVPS